MPKKQTTDHAAELEKALERWNDIRENGCNDPFWPDGVNMNLCRNHVIFHRRQLEETPTLFGFPDAYYREVPPEVPRGYMARADEIRDGARATLEAYRADPDYQFILVHSNKIPLKAQEKLHLGMVLNCVAGLEHAIAQDDLVTMRRHEHADAYLGSFESCARCMQDYLQGEGMEIVDNPAFDDSDDEDLDEDYGEEPEEEFGGMTMTM